MNEGQGGTMGSLGTILKNFFSAFEFYPTWARFLFWVEVSLVVIVVVVAVVLATLYPAAARKKELAAKEEGSAAKKVDIRIEYEPQSPYITLNPDGTDATGKPLQVYRFRFKIRNNSPAFTARKTYVMLTELLHEKEGHYVPEPRFESLPLDWEWNAPHDINPMREVYAPFGRVGNPAYQLKHDTNLSGGNEVPQFRFTVLAWPRYMPSHLDPGRHRFTVDVIFEGEPPVRQQFELDWSGKWSNDLESMLKEIKIKKVEKTSPT